MLAGSLKANPEVQIELTNDEGYVDIVDRGFDAGVRMGESVQKDLVAVPLGGSISVLVVGSPDYRIPASAEIGLNDKHLRLRKRRLANGGVNPLEPDLKRPRFRVDYKSGGAHTAMHEDQSRKAVDKKALI